jgi:hypothetical protein
MKGGMKEVKGELWFTGTNPGGVRRKKTALATPTVLLEADIEEDVLLSYEWLGDRSFDIHAKKQGLMAHVSGREIWLPRLVEPLAEEKEGFAARSVKSIPVCSGLRALDLFCGRKSAALALQKYVFQVVTLDNDESREPDICADILDWDYTVFPPGYFFSDRCTSLYRVQPGNEPATGENGPRRCNCASDLGVHRLSSAPTMVAGTPPRPGLRGTAYGSISDRMCQFGG